MYSTSEFLQALYQGADGIAEIRLLHKSGNYRLAKKIYRPANTIHTGDFSVLAEMNEDYHIYHRVNISRTEDSRKTNISQIVALYVDIDDNSNEAYTRLEDLAMPTCIIKSGGGFHGYWFLREPLNVDSPDVVKEVERTMQGMILAYGDGADDKAKDITRILRTPGFYNIKDKYDIPPLCEVVYLDDDKFGRYSYDDLKHRFLHLGAPPQATIRRHIPTQATGKHLPNRVKNFIQYGISSGSRNAELFYCARAYNDAGYSEGEAYNDLAGAVRAADFNDKEIKNCIRSAFACTPNPSTSIPSHMRNVMAIEDNIE